MTKIKICGITNIEDALAAAEYGADALGFIFYPKSPRAVSKETVRSIISELPPFITAVGVFVNESSEQINDIISYTGINTVQLHGTEPPEECGLYNKVIKAFGINQLSDIGPLDQYNMVSAFLLDTYAPDSPGGTGQTFNWEIAIEAKKAGRIILAGGLNPENIADAIRTVRPYGVDVSSGVEGPVKGKKDHTKLKLFIENSHSAINKSV